MRRSNHRPSAFGPWDLPWAIELANGDRCALMRGTLFFMAGQTIYYGCEEEARSSESLTAVNRSGS